MADSPISDLPALGGAPASGDMFVVVDVSDTSEASTGTTKRVLTSELFTTPNLTGPVTITGTITITGSTITVAEGSVLQIGGVNILGFTADNTARNTRLLIGVGGNVGNLQVSLAANDSGGTGFSMLRVPNPP